MLAINPLLPYFPDSISFLMYGLVTGLLLKFWKIAKKHLFLIPFFLVPYFAWAVIMFAFITVQPQERQAWFLFGFALTFVKIFSIIRTVLFSPFTWAFETITDGMRERRADKRDEQRREQRERDDRSNQEQNQDLFKEEQARREAEARANRARQSGNGQNHRQGDREKIEDKTQQKRQETQDIIKPAEGMRVFLTMVAKTKSIPFAIEHKPNSETIRVIEEAKRGENLVVCKDIDDLFHKLNI